MTCTVPEGPPHSSRSPLPGGFRLSACCLHPEVGAGVGRQDSAPIHPGPCKAFLLQPFPSLPAPQIHSHSPITPSLFLPLHLFCSPFQAPPLLSLVCFFSPLKSDFTKWIFNISFHLTFHSFNNSFSTNGFLISIVFMNINLIKKKPSGSSDHANIH